MPLVIRRAKSSDIEELLSLYLHLDADDRLPSIEQAKERLDLLQGYAGSCVLVGFVEETIAASCTLIVIPNITRSGQPYALIENVVTHASFRGRGFGRSLLRAAVDAAWKADCYKVILMTGSRKSSTLRFYASAGFEQNKTGFQVRRLPVRIGGE
jgi:GNAT superfamily N-acetyltransferase